MAIAWMKPLELQMPTVASPYDGDELLQTAVWQAYPQSDDEVSFLSHSVNEERYQLYTIVANMLPIVLSGNAADSPLPGLEILDPVAKLDGLRNVEKALLQWYQDLPPMLQYDSETPTPLADPQVNLQYVP